MYNGDLPPRKCLIAVHTRCGRGEDHKVVACRPPTDYSRIDTVAEFFGIMPV